jgi:sjoegren syndrome nuclear autoantigen 1
MAAKGQSMQGYNAELIKCIEDLRSKREELNRTLLRDEEEKVKIQKELTALSARLSKLNEDLARKMQVGRALYLARQIPAPASTHTLLRTLLSA